MASSVEPIASSQNNVAITTSPNNTASINYATRLAQQAQLFDLTLLSSIGGSNSNAQQQTTSTTTSLDNVDLLTLSPEALNLLNGVENTDSISTGVQVLSDSTFTTPLTAQQQDQLSGIITQFSGQPLDQNTLLQIQSQLTASGINPLQVSLQELILALETTALPSSYAANIEASLDDFDSTVLLAA